jgi:carboxylesterase type B
MANPAWGTSTSNWIANGTAAFNISAGYHPPNLTQIPAGDPVQSMPTASEDCLFLDLMVPKAIYDKAGQGAGAPV